VAKIMGHTPAARFGEAKELIGCALLLASDDASSFITAVTKWWSTAGIRR